MNEIKSIDTHQKPQFRESIQGQTSKRKTCTAFEQQNAINNNNNKQTEWC